MKKEIEITFGKSVLIEKSPTNNFLELINPLCLTVKDSYLHTHFSSTDTVTIIRYAPIHLPGYYAIRCVLIKEDEINPIFDIPKYVRAIMFHNSVGLCAYKTSVPNMELLDSRLVICHKEFIGEILLNSFKEIRELKFNDNILGFGNYNIDIPYRRCDGLCESKYLYGTHHLKWHKSTSIIRENLLASSSEKILYFETTTLLQKLKRKGRRLLKNSITLEPIKI